MGYIFTQNVSRVFGVEESEKAGQYTAAVIAQLNAEIAAAGLDVKKMAARMGVDYNTYRRYMLGERGMPMHLFWASLESLRVPEDEFVRRARTRLETEQAVEADQELEAEQAE